MNLRIAPALTALFLAGGAIACMPAMAAAQSVGAADDNVFDPPDTVYSLGDVPDEPMVERRRPVLAPHRAFLPVSIDLSSGMPAVGNQGRSQSCTAWATAYAARSYYTVSLEHRDISKPANLPSPNYLYHLARQVGCDVGSSVGRVVDVLKNGALSLAEYPFSDACVQPPSPELVARAHDFRVRGVSSIKVTQLDDIKGQLAQLNPVMISFNSSRSFMRFRGAETFAEPAPPPGDKGAGWHFMTLVGYDERRQAFRLINSWGKGWGDRGYAWVGYNLFKNGRVRGAFVLDMGQSSPQPNVPPGPGPAPGPTPAPIPPGPASQLSDLQKLSCARVNIEPRGGQSVLTGYVASDEDLNRVKSIAANAPNTSVGDMIVAPWPQCEALQTLERPLQLVDRPTIDIGSSTVLHEGDPLRIQVRSPAQISFLYVSYIQADGSVVHLVQPSGLVPQPTLPRQTLTFGDGEGGKAKFSIGPPFGREMIIAIASRSPFFDRDLPAHQTERDYLSELRRALMYKPAPDMPDRELAAAILTLQTSAR